MNFLAKMTSSSGINVVIGGDGTAMPYMATTEHPRYRDLLQACQDNDPQAFVDAYDVRAQVSINGQLRIEGDDIYYDGLKLHSALANKILELVENGEDTGVMLKFLERLVKNPSHRSVEMLYNFLEAHGLPLTSDGCFLAYKTVDPNYKDKWTHTIDNRVGSVIPRKRRNQVCDDPNRGCSHGYHAGALAYAGPGGYYNNSNDHVMIVKIDPEDVVSVPHDAHHRKIRVTFYEIVAEYEGTLNRPVYSDDYSSREEVDTTPTADDIFPGECYSFLFEHRDGSVRRRYIYVDDVTSTHIEGVRIHPEENVGGSSTTFSKDRISEIDRLEF